MERNDVILCPEDVTDFLVFAIFEAEHRKEVINFLSYFMHSGEIPLYHYLMQKRKVYPDSFDEA